MAQHGTAVFAHEQTRGKGQRSRAWASQKDQNIALSLVLQPQAPETHTIFLLSMAIAVGLRRWFLHLVPSEIFIKWPNDLYWRDRKAAGILIENVWQGGDWKFAIAGIGVNVNQTDFGPLVSRAVSLKQITGLEHRPLPLAKELCGVLNQTLIELHETPAVIEAEYRAALYARGRPVRFRKGNRVFEAIVRDVTSDGKLVVDHGVEERFDVGEVEWEVS